MIIRLLQLDRQTYLKLITLFSVALIVSSVPIDVLADTFRCPNGNFVSTGDSMGLVAAKCDRPKSKNRIGSSRSAGKRSSEWTYNMGPRDFIYILRFRNGKLASIENTGQYGN